MKKRPCRICGLDLNLWGPERRDLCPDCNMARRDMLIPCGQCGHRCPLGRMETVSICFYPGKKGSKRQKVYYCSSCIARSQARVRKTCEAQEAAVEKNEKALKRECAQSTKALVEY